jgi:hypothetical protein
LNLEDVLDPEYGLQQDEWSLHGGEDGKPPRFGDEGQLEVVGWSGKQGGRHRLYVLKCTKCSQDGELFGQGYFRSLKYRLVNGSVPCGCSKKLKWSKNQYDVLCSRKAKGLGYTFLGFVGEWQGKYTKIKMLCEKHGEWSSGTIHNLINKGVGCPGCWIDTFAKSSSKPDDTMIVSFHKSGAFHPDTKFWRSERKTKQGYKAYWFMSCPECGETGESYCGNLQKGCRPCACNMHRQQECYINWLIDDHNNAVAIKFGIARDSKRRVKDQNRSSAYTLRQHGVYTFPDVTSCNKAERECKKELECGIVLKRDMPDGYSETTWAYNIGKVKDIYERNGGVLVE